MILISAMLATPLVLALVPTAAADLVCIPGKHLILVRERDVQPVHTPGVYVPPKEIFVPGRDLVFLHTDDTRIPLPGGQLVEEGQVGGLHVDEVDVEWDDICVL